MEEINNENNESIVPEEKHDDTIDVAPVESTISACAVEEEVSPHSDEAAAGATSEDRLSFPAADWINSLKHDLKVDENRGRLQTKTAERLIYIMGLSRDGTTLLLQQVLIMREEPSGWVLVRNTELRALKGGSASYITESDVDIINLFEFSPKRLRLVPGELPDVPEISRIVIERLLATNRCFWEKHSDCPLSLGPTQTAMLNWHADDDGYQTLRVGMPHEGKVLALGGGVAWYVDRANNVIGELQLPTPAKTLSTLLNAPPVDPTDVKTVRSALTQLGLAIPLPEEITLKQIDVAPTPCLSLTTVPVCYNNCKSYFPAGYSYGSTVPIARLTFEYGDDVSSPDSNELRCDAENVVTIRGRNPAFESRSFRLLQDRGMLRVPEHQPDVLMFPNDREGDWCHFVSQELPALELSGWRIRVEHSFPYNVVIPEQEEWQFGATSGNDFWFSMALDITVEGQKYPLLPIVQEAIYNVESTSLDGDISMLNHHGTFYAPLPDGRKVALPFERVRAIVETLVELFNKEYKTKPKKEKIDISVAQAFQLFERLGIPWNVPDQLKALIEKFRAFQIPKHLSPPESFRAELRPYQTEALGWFDFIREFGLGGILADDMGLGKTVQTLAHIAIEKSQGRATKPYLVVCPKSVLPNWLSEIERFVPSMQVLALSDSSRSSYFDKIDSSDIVLTTYPLIAKDFPTLAKHEWQAVILDESQIVKNSKTNAAIAVRSLRAHYRICLTGTPVENSLRDLWSQFDFAIPNYLGSRPWFKTTFRRPIEMQNISRVQLALAARIKPFMLRRTKELVASDLPEKSIITRHIELNGAQRDLYETVRVAMYGKVREAMLTKGAAKSQIILLDAMLKLRQVCCDPRIVSLAAAKNVSESAKLETLMEMLQELHARGRRVLLFSQFTSMLNLIIPELVDRGINYVELRGDTIDRKRPVMQFQSGNVPLFLLSLKVGSLGLNLTAADTVIHYDPWWNPAVESQATDRAHRIGQTHKVFVYRLITSNTIEQKMLELQEHKRNLAASIYTNTSDNVSTMFSNEDIELLFRSIYSPNHRRGDVA